MFKVNIYTAVLPGTPRRTEKTFGYVLSCIYCGEEQTKGGFETLGDATFHEANLRAIIAALERLNQSCEVHIHSEDRFILNMIEHNLAKWQKDDFKTAKGTPIENEEGWREYWKLSRGQLIILHHGKHEFTEWISERIKQREQQ